MFPEGEWISSWFDAEGGERKPRMVGEEDRALTACQKYTSLAARLASEGAPAEDLGEAYLRAAWSARFDELGLRPALRTKALAAFLVAADLPDASFRTQYLAAELLRLNGRFKESAARFRAVLALPDEDEESVDLHALASLILSKAEAGDAEDVEFRWDEEGEGRWVERTKEDEARERKERDANREDFSFLAESLSSTPLPPPRRLPNGRFEL